MQKILFTCFSLARGGRERQLIQLITDLPKNKFDIHLLLFEDRIEYNGIGESSVTLHIMSPGKRQTTFRFFYEIYFFLRKLSEIQPDIVHTWDALSSLYIAILTPLFSFSFINGMIRDAPPSLSLKMKLISAVSFLASKVIVANSLAGLASYGADKKNGVVIYNGFDDERIKNLKAADNVRAELNLGDNFVIGMVANYSQAKDYDLFVEIANRLVKKIPNVIFIGIGKDAGNYDRVKNKVLFPEKVFLLEQRPNIEEIVSVFHIGMLLSTQGEGISNSIMEYMALGKPVICSKWPGNMEIVEDGKNGFVVAGRDADEFCDKISQLLSSNLLYNQIVKNNRNKIENVFSNAAMLKHYNDIYVRT